MLWPTNKLHTRTHIDRAGLDSTLLSTPTIRFELNVNASFKFRFLSNWRWFDEEEHMGNTRCNMCPNPIWPANGLSPMQSNIRSKCMHTLSFPLLLAHLLIRSRMQALVPQWGPKVRTTRHRWFDKCVSCVCARETLILCKFQLEKIYSSRKYYPRKLRFSFATRIVYVVISIPFPFQFSVPANCSECIFIHCSMWSDATNTTYNKKMEKNACDNLEKRTIK